MGQTTSTDQEAPDRIFRHEHTEMEVPGSWVDDSIVRITKMPAGKNPPNIIMSRDRLNPEETLAEYAARNVEALGRGFKGLKVRHRGRSNHAHFDDAYQMTYHWTLPNGVVMVQQQLIVRIVQKVLILYGTCTQTDYREHQPTFDRVFASFRRAVPPETQDEELQEE